MTGLQLNTHSSPDVRLVCSGPYQSQRQFSSVQVKMVFIRSEKPICAQPGLPEASPTLALKRFQCSSDDGPLSSFQGRSCSASSGVMSLALYPQVVSRASQHLRSLVSQASQHLRSPEKQTTCEGCFARQSICSAVSLLSGMSRAVRPQEFSKVDVWVSHSTFHFFSLGWSVAGHTSHIVRLVCNAKCAVPQKTVTSPHS